MPSTEPLTWLSTMPLFLYRCPNTGLRVQGFSADDVAVDTHTYEPVNPATGVVLGAPTATKPSAASG